MIKKKSNENDGLSTVKRNPPIYMYSHLLCLKITIAVEMSMDSSVMDYYDDWFSPITHIPDKKRIKYVG